MDKTKWTKITVTKDLYEKVAREAGRMQARSGKAASMGDVIARGLKDSAKVRRMEREESAAA